MRTATMPTLPPNRPRKKHRTFMIEDPAWNELRDNAADDGKAASEVIRELILAYNSRKGREKRRTG